MMKNSHFSHAWELPRNQMQGGSTSKSDDAEHSENVIKKATDGWRTNYDRV